MRFVLLRRPPTHSTTRIRIEEILRIRRREYLGLIHTHAAATGAPLEDNMHSHLEDDPDDRAQTRSARPTTHLERAELEVEPMIELAPLLAADNVVPVAHRDPPTTHPTPARHRSRTARAAAQSLPRPRDSLQSFRGSRQTSRARVETSKVFEMPRNQRSARRDE